MQQSVAASGERIAGASQGLALIVLGGLPTMAIVSLVPNLPQLLQHFSQVPNHEYWVPMIITVPSLCIALFSPVAGAIADKWGRKNLLLVSLIAFGLIGMLPMLMDNLFAIIGTRFVIGLAEAGILTSSNALMGDYFAGDERHKWLGHQATLGTIIATALILIGGALGGINWHAPFIMYAVGLVIFFWVATSFWEPAKRADDNAPGSRFPWSAAVTISIVTIGIALIYFVQALQLGRIFSELGVKTPAQISLFTATASVGVLLGGYFYRKVAAHGVAWVFGLAFTAFAIGYAGLSRAPNPWVGLPIAVVAQFGNGLVFPALLSWALGKYDFEHRGRGMGLWGSCFFIGMFASPALLTALGQISSASFLQIVGAVGLACAVVALLAFRGSRRLKTA